MKKSTFSPLSSSRFNALFSPLSRKVSTVLDKVFSHRLLSGYGFPIVVSIILHILILGLLTGDWSSNKDMRVVPPRNIKASVVEVTQPKPAAPKVQPRPVVDDSAQKAKALAERKKAEAHKKAEARRQQNIALKKERDAKEKARKEEEARKERDRQQRLADEKRKKQQDDMLRQLERERIQREQAQAAQEQAAQEQADKDASEVAYYSGVLQNLIAQNWNRPPSARNNMMATIQVSFSPYGDLQEVRLLEGSGNDSYDRSVIQAIKKAAPFPELKKLDRRIFNENFRRINFRFRPEDLVR